MGATVLRWLKWAVLAWGTVSLLGLAVLVGVAWSQQRAYEERVIAAESGPDREGQRVDETRRKLQVAGLGDDALARIERYDESVSAWNGLQLRQVHLKNFKSIDGQGGWLAGNRLPAHVAAALRDSAAHFASRNVRWFPSPDVVATSSWRVLPWDVTFGEQGLRDIDLVLLQPATGIGWLVRGNHLDPTAATDRIYCGGQA